MSTNATTLISSIKVRTAAVLGSTYSELAYVNDLSKNSFKGNFKRYGVIPKDINEVSSVTQYVTLEQTFELILIDSYINTPMSDSAQQALGPALQDLAFDIYRNLISTKAGSPSIVILVSDFQSNQPELIPETNAVVIKSQFKIRYRNSI